jgi:phenylacetate-CoA ligase
MQQTQATAQARLSRLLEYGTTYVPRYKGLRPRISEFPIVGKMALRSEPEVFVSDMYSGVRNSLCAFLRNPTVGAHPEVSFNSSILIDQTSGTNGVPFRFPKLKSERAECALNIWGVRKGLDALITPLNIYSINHAPPSQRAPRTIEGIVRVLSDRKTRWLHAGSRFLKALLAAVADGRVQMPPGLRFVENSGSRMPPELLVALHASKIEVADQYGCREAWAIGYGDGGLRFQVIQQNVFVEVVDRLGRSEAEGVVGRILVTALHQSLFPFIRYDTGDVGRILSDGNGNRFVQLEEHRACERIIGSSEYGSDVFKGVLDWINRNNAFPSLTYIQIRQKSDSAFSVIIPHIPQPDLFVKLLSSKFNERGILQKNAEFTICPTEPDSTSFADKDLLFTNRYYAPDLATD